MSVLSGVFRVIHRAYFLSVEDSVISISHDKELKIFFCIGCHQTPKRSFPISKYLINIVSNLTFYIFFNLSCYFVSFYCFVLVVADSSCNNRFPSISVSIFLPIFHRSGIEWISDIDKTFIHEWLCLTGCTLRELSKILRIFFIVGEITVWSAYTLFLCNVKSEKFILRSCSVENHSWLKGNVVNYFRNIFIMLFKVVFPVNQE